MESITRTSIAAPPARVFALASQVPRWAELLPHYRAVAVERRVGERILARMVCLRSFGPVALPVAWRAEHWVETTDHDDLRLRFRHVRGLSRGMDVTWHIRPLDGGAGSDVSIEHHFQRRLPLLGDELLPALVDRFFVRPIAGRTLATFKSLAEGGTPT